MSRLPTSDVLSQRMKAPSLWLAGGGAYGRYCRSSWSYRLHSTTTSRSNAHTTARTSSSTKTPMASGRARE